MGGAFSKKKKASQQQMDRQNRRLSVTGLPNIGFDKNTEGQSKEKGATSGLRYACLSNAGYEPDGNKKTNQDAYVSISEFGHASVSLFGVFDGHGAVGHLVSAYVKRMWPLALDKETLRAQSVRADGIDSSVVSKMLEKSFIEVNKSLEVERSIDSSLSGTTAVGGVVIGVPGKRKVIIANSGDSRAIMATMEGGRMVAKPLSDDQKPDREDERRRIIASGGRVEPLFDEDGEPIGPARVWLPNMMLPGLAMSRSLGDDIAATVGVYANPEVLVYDMSDADKFMVIASDGVWEFLSNEEVVKIVEGCNGDAERAVQEICARSYQEWRAEEEVVDDITAVVVYFE
mmetsp:Transcript_33318/g.74674  ORF Transcript_33318/g.74674 Transcript_33318/m.74674 type:complete len:344 (+) Transcript_33318:87-1118(+)